MHEARCIPDGPGWRAACQHCGWVGRFYLELDQPHGASWEATSHWLWWAYLALDWQQCDHCRAEGLPKSSALLCRRCAHRFNTRMRYREQPQRAA